MAGRFPDPGQEYDPQWAQDLIRTLNQDARDQKQPKGVGYSVTNFTVLRTLDGTSGTLQQTKDFVCTLVQDLINVGFLKD